MLNKSPAELDMFAIGKSQNVGEIPGEGINEHGQTFVMRPLIKVKAS